MLNLTNIQFLACTIALLVVIALAVGLFRVNHKVKKVVFHEFSDAEYDLEFLRNGESSETAEWLTDGEESFRPIRLHDSSINDLKTRPRGANRWDGDLN